MPRYEYRCRECDGIFEMRRPMSESGDPATCPSGHDGAVRVLSEFASIASTPAAGSAQMPPCGAACGTPEACMGMN